MRLRSSQFVFLLLLVCSVQTREDIALHLVAGAISGHTTVHAEHREAHTAVAAAGLENSFPRLARERRTRLEAAETAVHGAPWPVRRPVLDAASVSSFTGLLRA